MQELSNNAATEPDGGGAPFAQQEVPQELTPDADLQDLQDLRQELSKWQARVPKLAAALRERTDQAQQLQAKLDALAKPDPGTQARDDLIAELEAKLGALNSKHQELHGQLHSRDMEINGLRQDLADWKSKWHSMTRTLDDQVSQTVAKDAGLQNVKDELAVAKAALQERSGAAAEQDHELQMLRDETESLGKRNAQLFETTELANRQIEALGDSLAGLREQVAAKDAQLADAKGHSAVLADQLSSRDAEIKRFDADIDALHALVETKQHSVQELESQVAEQASAREQTAQLEESLAQAGNQVAEREVQIQDLQQRMEDQAAQSQQTIDDQAAQLQRTIDEHAAQLQRVMDEQAVRLQKAMDDGATKLAELETRCEDQHTELAEHAKIRESHQQAEEQVQGELQIREAKIAALEACLGEERREIARLEACVGNAEQVTGEREEERRELSAQVKTAGERVKHLENQLDERSSLVMGLEREKLASEQETRELRSKTDLLDEKLEKSERHAAEHAEHITQLDSRLERQKELMARLEEEMVQKQQEVVSQQKAGAKELADKDKLIASLRQELTALPAEPATDMQEQANAPEAADEARALRHEVQKLELMLRDCTEEMNQLRWQQNMAAQADAAGAVDGKMLVVLNQQLNDARASNDGLAAKVRELEAQLLQAPTLGEASTAQTGGDDLTCIKGVGPKVASQLHELGICCFMQLAELEPEALDDDSHPLNAFKGRIIKDAWIEQARQLELGK